MVLVIMLIFAIACALIANSKGRSAVGWFFIGLFITWIGLIIILVLPNEHERQRQESAARADRRRLREQLRQERMKNEAYRRHAAARLDMHDRALGMDTRRQAALAPGHGMQQPALSPAAGSAPPPAVNAPREWFYELDGESRGPVTASAIRSGLAQGRLEGTTLVWREGMHDWQAVAEVVQFRASFRM